MQVTVLAIVQVILFEIDCAIFYTNLHVVDPKIQQTKIAVTKI